MTRGSLKTLAAGGIVLLSLLGAGWTIHTQTLSKPSSSDSATTPHAGPIPVRVALVERRVAIEDRRDFSGVLEPRASFVVTSEVGGQVQEVLVDLGDTVTRGQIVARLDRERFARAHAEARSELAVARSEHAAAQRQVQITARLLRRVEALRERGIAPEEEFEATEAEALAAESQEQIARARIERAKSALRTAKLELDYTVVRAAWSEDRPEPRFVASRHVDPGQRLAAQAPLLTVVSLDPIDAIVFVAEEDYGRIRVGLPVEVRAEAFPGETFSGEVARISPVFQTDTATARIEVAIANPDLRLKPGMFIQASTILDRADRATVVPEEAVVMYEGKPTVFVIPEGASQVTRIPVEVGIRNANRVQVFAEGLEGRVVTLGHDQLQSGSEVTVPPASVDALQERS